MEAGIKGDLKEIAALVIEAQERHPEQKAENICITGSIPREMIRYQITGMEQ